LAARIDGHAVRKSKDADVSGRSTMSKDELAKALREQG